MVDLPQRGRNDGITKPGRAALEAAHGDEQGNQGRNPRERSGLGIGRRQDDVDHAGGRRDLLVERTQAGLARAKSDGKRWAVRQRRPPTCARRLLLSTQRV